MHSNLCFLDFPHTFRISEKVDFAHFCEIYDKSVSWNVARHLAAFPFPMFQTLSRDSLFPTSLRLSLDFPNLLLKKVSHRAVKGSVFVGYMLSMMVFWARNTKNLLLSYLFKCIQTVRARLLPKPHNLGKAANPSKIARGISTLSFERFSNIFQAFFRH